MTESITEKKESCKKESYSEQHRVTGRTMFNTLGLYDELLHATNKDERSRIIAQGFEMLQSRYPDLEHIATKHHVTETELRLQKEIENTRAEIENTRLEIKELEIKLTKEIENTRAEIENTRLEIKELEIKLTKEIENTRAEIENTRLEIKELDVRLTKEITDSKNSMIKWMIGLWVGGAAVAVSIVSLYMSIPK